MNERNNVAGAELDGERRLHTWEIADPAERRKSATGILNELGAMVVPPASTAEREFYGSELWAYIFCDFAEDLSLAEQTFLETLPRRVLEKDANKEDPGHRRIRKAFGRYLAEQFGVWGWRLLMSRGALEQLAQWEIHSIELVDLFGKSLGRRARLLQKKKGGRSPVRGKDIRRADELVPKLRTLFRKAYLNFGKGKEERTNSKLIEFIQKEIDAQPEQYQPVVDNWTNLAGFIRKREDIASQIWRGRIRPERFLHMLFEDVTGYSWGHLKNLKS